MQVPAAWASNPNANNNRRVYDSGSVVYDSGLLTFDGITTGQSQITTEIPTTWSEATSGGTSWVTNPNAYTATDPYDSTDAYDATGNYDAVVPGQSFITTETPTNWSVV